MNKRILCTVLLSLVFGYPMMAAMLLTEEVLPSKTDPVVKVEGAKDLFQTGDIFITGQPTLETLRMLKSQGVVLVVNLRSESENKEFTAASFHEENVVKELGMAYSPLPIAAKEDYQPKTVERLSEILKAHPGKTLIHCASGGRASYLWMAYLVRYRQHSIDQAAEIGRQMKFTLPVEDFLGTKIHLSLAKE